MKELFIKSIKESTLRHACLSGLPNGAKVISRLGAQGEVLSHFSGKVVFGWETGEISIFDYGSLHCIYLAPLCFVEDKPVYKGDTLYRQSGERVTVRGLHDNGAFMLFEEGGSWAIDRHISQVSWTKPVTTININGHEVPMPEREAPGGDTEYFFPSFQQEGGVCSYAWFGDAYDNRLLSAGMVHLTEEAARKHAEVLASFTRLKR